MSHLVSRNWKSKKQNYFLWSLTYCYFFIKHADNFSVKLTKIYCTDIDERYFRNVSCRIKAVRGKLGVLYQHWEYVNVSKLSACYTGYYKNHGGHFLPYMLNMCVDLCKFGEIYTKGNPMIKIIMKLAIGYDTAIQKGCPLNVSVVIS